MTPPVCDLCPSPAEPGSALCAEHEWTVRVEGDPPPEDDYYESPRPMGSGHGGAGR